MEQQISYSKNMQKHIIRLNMIIESAKNVNLLLKLKITIYILLLFVYTC